MGISQLRIAKGHLKPGEILQIHVTVDVEHLHPCVPRRDRGLVVQRPQGVVVKSVSTNNWMSKPFFLVSPFMSAQSM